MAKFMSRRHGETDIKVSNVKAFDNEKYNGLEIEWFSNEIGFGHFTILLDQDDEGNIIINGASECMCSNSDKRFLRALFDELIDKINIVE